jgi:AcrR family transcriptional regulator
MKDALKTAPQESPVQPAAVARRRGRPAGNASHAIPEDRVLDLAFHAFAQRGYEGTTLRELAKQLGVSHNLLNVRFGSKADLWRRAVDARVARIGPPVFAAFDATALDEEARLRELIHRFCRWAADNGEFVGLSYVEARRATWRNDHIVDAYLHPFRKRLDALLAEVAAKRPVRAISTSAFMAMLVQGVGFYFASGPMLDRLGVGDEIAPNNIEAQVSMFAEFILAALLPPAEG